jgi:hypothetical protein
MAGPVLTGDPRNFFGFAIFCDDIRQEVSGKISLIGTYTGVMYLHGGDFPFAIPKFGMVFSYFEKHEAAQPSPLILKIWFPGDEAAAPSLEVELPIEQIRQKAQAERSLETTPEGQFVRLDTHILLTNVLFKEEGRVVARVYREGGEEVRLGTLRIKKAKPPVTPAPPNEN